MASLINLPGYEIPRNALLDTSGINNAIDSNRQNALMQQKIGLQERQVNLQEQSGAREQDVYNRGKAKDEALMAGGVVQHISSLPPDQQAGAWAVARMTPGFKELPPDMHDFSIAGPKILTAAAKYGYVNPLEKAQKEAELAGRRANTAHVVGSETRAAEMHPLDVRAKEKALDATKYMTVAPGATVYDTAKGTPVLTTAPKMDSTDKRNLYAAQDELPALKSALDSLDEALQLNKTAYSGVGASTGGYLGSRLPGPGILFNEGRAKATSRYEQITNQQAIESMSRTLKGATTDKEMAKFLSIIADTGQPPDVREKALLNLRTIAARHMQTKVDRIRELGGNVQDFARENGTPSAAPEVTGASAALTKLTDDAAGHAAYDQLRPGERYVDPNGNFRTKQ